MLPLKKLSNESCRWTTIIFTSQTSKEVVRKTIHHLFHNKNVFKFIFLKRPAESCLVSLAVEEAKEVGSRFAANLSWQQDLNRFRDLICFAAFVQTFSRLHYSAAEVKTLAAEVLVAVEGKSFALRFFWVVQIFEAAQISVAVQVFWVVQILEPAQIFDFVQMFAALYSSEAAQKFDFVQIFVG